MYLTLELLLNGTAKSKVWFKLDKQPEVLRWSTAQKGPLVALHKAQDLTLWTLLRHLEITLFMLVTVLSAAAVTFYDSVLAPFLQVDLDACRNLLCMHIT